MNKSLRILFMQWLCGCIACISVSGLMGMPLFDTHLHYNIADAKQLSPPQIIKILNINAIQYALVTSSPPMLAQQLYQQAPDKILPLLGVYHKTKDKETWMHDDELPSRIESQLKQGHWYGIGELHLFASNRHSAVFKDIIKLAKEYKLPLLLHADPAVIDTVYVEAPDHPVIWAHAGTYPYPDLIADYLKRYPALRVDLSVRDERITHNGMLRDDWYDLLVTYSDRFMTGVDTYSLSRWKNFDSVVTSTHKWLQQLPLNVTRKIAYNNAATLFAKHVRLQSKE